MSAPATQKCRVCGAEAPETATRCPNCTAALGVLAPCPHCRAVAGVSPDAEFKFRCDVCGGPRVPRGRGFEPSGREAGHLKAADRARKARAAWRGATVGAGALAALMGGTFGVIALLFGLGLGLFVTGTLVLAPLVAFAFFAAARARARGREIAPALDAAWVSAANDVASARGGVVSATELAQSLGIDEAQAEELAAQLDVDAIVGSTAAASVAASAGQPRARVAISPTSAGDGSDDALAEAEAEAAAADPAKRAARLP